VFLLSLSLYVCVCVCIYFVLVFVLPHSGLLHSDLIGFHTTNYARHFRSACTRLLGVESTPVTVAYNHLNVRIGTFPVGINPTNFIEGVKSEPVLETSRMLHSRYGLDRGQLLLLGVDRFDYIKGLPQKLAAFEHFLKSYPEFEDRVTLVGIAVCASVWRGMVLASCVFLCSGTMPPCHAHSSRSPPPALVLCSPSRSRLPADV
jgi:Glycosyltransferase family 20